MQSETDNSRLDEPTFRAVLEAAPDGILLVDDHGGIVLANAQVEALFGYTRAELIGRRVELLMPERFRSMHVSHRDVYVEHPETRPMGRKLELWGLRKDGSEFPVEISLSPGELRDRPLVTVVVRDVSERQRIESALRRSEERYRLLAEHAQDLIYRLDLTTSPPSFEYVSPAALEAIGQRPEDLYADPSLFLGMIHPGDRSTWDEALTAGAERVITLREYSPGGELRWCEHRLVPIFDAHGTLVAVEGIARDITERRESEDEQRRVVADIEKQLERERIAHDLHDDIIQSAYAVGLGLHAARNNASISKEAALDRATADLNAVIADLRAYMQRLSAGTDAVAADEVLRGRVETLLASGPARPQWTFDFDLPALRPEEGRQLFLLTKEMISNVWRHADAEHAWITISLEDGEQGNEGGSDWIVLAVRDDGIGFDAQGDRPGSFGLRGLDQRASDLGGSISIQSTPGRGTRIEARLPRPATSLVERGPDLDRDEPAALEPSEQRTARDRESR